LTNARFLQFQLRDYRIKPGEMDDWLEEWSSRIRPLREAAGFTVVGAWAVRDQDRFLWILAHDDFEAADQRYYASAERRAIHPDPARHLAQTEQAFIEPMVAPPRPRRRHI
jgi:hypothetical protein